MYKKAILKFSVSLLIATIVSSCVSSKKIIYFQDNGSFELNNSIENTEPKIQEGDLLSINVSATDAEAALPFNLYETPVVSGAQYASLKPIYYLVDTNGEINFPVLGKLKVEGYTTEELIIELQRVLSDGYIQDPIINLRIKNFKVSILGEVKKPGTYIVENERINILEAIALSGDLTIHGKRANIMLIRIQGGQKIFIPIDITDKELFNSEYFNLVQNDIIYVSPNKAKVNSSAVGAHTAVIISSVSLLIALMALLVR